MKNSDRNPYPERGKVFSQLLKPILGVLLLILLLIGVMLFMIFRPDFSAEKETKKEQLLSEASGSSEQSALAPGDGIDAETGLVASAGLELIKANCTNCHSSALIIQNRFTREGWKEKIVWMQETQGLWPLGESEEAILDYLAEHYAPAPYLGRRAPLREIEWYELED
ncbi:hypothetical protein [Algoriphagus halophytocola]|uniref:Monoheme cytochrome C n=1 Tax=Algoriphagus halophytocola TaxID=2991499 RepID=A0ABY6MLH9_9BACT|nr:hypothetical protein [Algoriphagus sp. TR-M5]UZD23995.1 hypothetical protein OM944_05740 [Algoriphagus sp. TR-M5]